MTKRIFACTGMTRKLKAQSTLQRTCIIKSMVWCTRETNPQQAEGYPVKSRFHWKYIRESGNPPSPAKRASDGPLVWRYSAAFLAASHYMGKTLEYLPCSRVDWEGGATGDLPGLTGGPPLGGVFWQAAGHNSDFVGIKTRRNRLGRFFNRPLGVASGLSTPKGGVT